RPTPMSVTEPAAIAEPAPLARRERPRLRAFCANRMAVAGAVFLVVVIGVALLAPLLAPHDPTNTRLLDKFAGPSRSHPFGTDTVGRDVLSRLMFATRTSLFASLASVGCAVVIAVPLGMIAGYFGR